MSYDLLKYGVEFYFGPFFFGPFFVVGTRVLLFTHDAGCMCRPAVVLCTIFADLISRSRVPFPHKTLAASVSCCGAVFTAR